jgi:sulfite reductase (NADPH) flavoprotein alpha-component
MSQSSFKLPSNAPFQHEQRVALEALLPTLQPGQSAWLSGYFAALDQLPGNAGSPAGAVAPAAAPAAPAPSEPLTILYGSESGNAEGLAFETEKAAKKAGFKTTVVDMGDYEMDKLKGEKNVFVIVSTWGEGEPPERATDFYDFVMGDSAPKLEGINFSVCALGDTSYADFCECGRRFDNRFAELGAKRIADRVECDVDFEATFKQWLDAALPAMVEACGLKEKLKAAAAAPAPVATVTAGSPAGPGAIPVVEGFSKKNPFPSMLKERVLLNGTGSKKETIHLEYDLEGSGLTYEPGDVLGVFPENCPDVVEDFVRLAGFRGDEIREVDGNYLSLTEMLAGYDVTGLSKAFMTKYAPLAKHKGLDRLLLEENKEKCSEWLWGRELRDLFLEFPPSDALSVDQLLKMLRKMPPRLYSIASSMKAHPNEVHLTVAIVRYLTHGRSRKGVCSSYLGDRLDVGETTPVFLHHNKNFKLPESSDTPIIMVGPGTGIAPFRAFVEDRVATGAKGKSWLFFGDWTFNFDFLYQLEWQNYLKNGQLSRMDVAFSRDTDQKVYVQHRMKEKGKDLYAWLEEGAHFYVCGDASRMAKDVHQTLIDVVAEHGGKSVEDAEAYVDKLKKDKRYQRDVY